MTRVGWKVLLPCLVALVVALAGGAWLALVQPKRAEAARLEQAVESTRVQLAARRALAERVDMAAIVLHVSRVAADAGIVFRSIAPQDPVAESGYTRIPIDVTFDGQFGRLAGVLERLRSLVRVRNGEINATGPLFSVAAVRLAEAEVGFPRVEAIVTVDAFVFDGGATEAAPPAAVPGAPAEPAATPSSGAVAAGATP